MEFLSSSTPMPEAGMTVYPWMSVRAASVTTNKLSLVANGNSPPQLSGLPASRSLFIKNYAINEDIDIVFPINEKDVSHPIAPAPIDGVITYASDAQHLTFLGEHLDFLGFSVVLPGGSIAGMLRAEIILDVVKLLAAMPVSPGDHIVFRILAFESEDETFASVTPVNEGWSLIRLVVGPLVTGLCQSPQATAVISIPLGGNASPNSQTRYFCFKIQKVYQDAVEVTLNMASVTLNLTQFEGIAPPLPPT